MGKNTSGWTRTITVPINSRVDYYYPTLVLGLQDAESNRDEQAYETRRDSNPPCNEKVNPEVVATSPCRIKSPVPVCCGFGFMGVRRRDSHPLRRSHSPEC